MNVSNSEIIAHNLCEQQHDYQYVQKLIPKSQYLKPALFRGITGHNALELSYRELQQGASVDTARKAAMHVLQEAIKELPPEEFRTIKVVLELQPLLDMYFDVYQEESFKVLEVEKQYEVELVSEVPYNWKIDLLLEFTKGPHRGDICVGDHKFAYNFRSQKALEMDPQGPKYILGLKKLGITVSKIMFNQIRTRFSNPKERDVADIFNRHIFKPKLTVMENIWEEQKETAMRIYNRSTPIRTLSPLVCDRCDFQELCYAEMSGQDTSIMKAVNFELSTYGYE